MVLEVRIMVTLCQKGWVSTGQRHKWIFWGLDNVLFVFLGLGANGMYICESLSSCNLTFVHFSVCILYLDKKFKKIY